MTAACRRSAAGLLSSTVPRRMTLPPLLHPGHDRITPGRGDPLKGGGTSLTRALAGGSFVHVMTVVAATPIGAPLKRAFASIIRLIVKRRARPRDQWIRGAGNRRQRLASWRGGSATHRIATLRRIAAASPLSRRPRWAPLDTPLVRGPPSGLSRPFPCGGHRAYRGTLHQREGDTRLSLGKYGLALGRSFGCADQPFIMRSGTRESPSKSEKSSRFDRPRTMNP